MSLSARDRHLLAQIEEEIAGADPRFAARLSAFARLADGGAMPERERIREPRRLAARPVRGGLMRWIAVAMAVAVTLAVISAALVGGRTGGKGACAEWQGLVCTRQAAPSAPAGQKDRAPSLAP